MTANGSAYELRSSARAICGNGSLSSQRTWHTPSTEDHATEYWPTPTEDNASTKSPYPNLALEVTLWQTPGTDSFRSRGGDRKDEPGLDQQARFFPTPAARDYRTPNKRTYQERSETKKGEQLQNFVEHRFPSLPVPAIQDGPPFSESVPISRRRLNPRFVEWLMGFPIGWTEL
jgi:hypothetical protein